MVFAEDMRRRLKLSKWGKCAQGQCRMVLRHSEMGELTLYNLVHFFQSDLLITFYIIDGERVIKNGLSFSTISITKMPDLGMKF